jgi:environmental stress-induced protein Ves
VSAGLRIAALDPATYRRTPWKNGGGVTIDIADAYQPGATPGGWDGMIWRFGRTGTRTRAPFSDLTGYDRILAVVVGRGAVLETPGGEIDVREPFRPVRFRGETPIVARLEAGPVEVVNLIGDRNAVRLDMAFLNPGEARALAPGIHVAYAPTGPIALASDSSRHDVPPDHALRIDAADPASLRCESGLALIASIVRVV